MLVEIPLEEIPLSEETPLEETRFPLDETLLVETLMEEILSEGLSEEIPLSLVIDDDAWVAFPTHKPEVRLISCFETVYTVIVYCIFTFKLKLIYIHIISCLGIVGCCTAHNLISIIQAAITILQFTK